MLKLHRKEFLIILRPLRKRMFLNNALRCLFASLSAAGTAALCLSYISLWVPVPFLMNRILLIFLAGTAAGVLVSFFLQPALNSLIITADRLGLKERVVTAWQLRDDDSQVAELQRDDARKAIMHADFKKLYPLRFPSKLAIALAASVILTAVSFAIPGYARDDARRIEALKDEVEKQTEILDKVEKDIEKKNALTDKELEKIRDELEALKADMEKAGTEEDALKALSRAQNELEKMDPRKQLNQLGKALSGSETTRELGDALKNDNMTDMKQALEQLRKQMEQGKASPGELAEMLEQAAAQLDNKEISDELKQEAQKIASADAGSQSDAMQGLSDALSRMMGQQGQGSAGLGEALGQLSQALQQARGAVAQVDNRLGASGESSQGGAMSGKQTGSQGDGTGEVRSAGGSQQQQGGGEGQNGSDGQGGGDGQSGSEGQSGGQSGSGGQSKNGGGGAGEGSTSNDAGYTGSESSGAGRAPGERKEEEYERLYDPERLGGSNTPDQVSGRRQEGGQSQFTQADGMPVEKGEVLPYREVLGRYKDEAASYMEDTEIPAAMKQIVREYFESLE